MKWHVEGRTKDGRMRHPADTPIWQSFDYQNPEFAKDSRNIILGLAFDGFNPFKSMNVNHSTWPVVLMPYNLPPWMCMKQPYFMLSLLIPGPCAPGNNIDVYLQALIAELKELWDVGMTTYDASSKENFQMHPALLWTISDFPGYANLSSWSTKGYLACPVCHKHTVSHHLRHGSKQCYMGHRRFLEKEHPYRKDKRHFDRKEEHGVAPARLTGLHPITDEFGRAYLPPACFYLDKKENELFCKILKKVKVPDAYSATISKYLCTLKNYVRNRSRPEGSIAEGYLVDKCLTFCSLYLSNEVTTKFNRSSRNEDGGESSTEGLEIFSIQGRPLGKGNSVAMDDETIKKAHQYVIFNCEAMDPYINQHRKLVEEQHLRSSKHEKERIHSETFANWFDNHVDDFLPENEVISKDLRLLAKGPNVVGSKYERYIVNGFRFHTKYLESKRKNQNSGVIVTAITSSFASTKDMNLVSSDLAYYGVLKDILELDYGGGRRVVLFDCDWVSKGKRLKQDDDGFTLVNFMNVKRHHEPFVLASQVKQVFYVEDPLDKGWNVVIPTIPRDDLKMDPIDVEMYLQSQPSSSHQRDTFDDINWVREGVIGEIVDTTRVAFSSKE
ncbi:uncharacterized protein [Coffea arabica]|uniref:DUF4218 domain-containing protein n=1 Tax=Coffea arabica TaxID=13443 RepID=A0A6P6SNU5_COFAR